MILSAAMLLRHTYQLEDEADAIERAVESVLTGGLRTADLARQGEASVTTAQMGAAVAAAVLEEREGAQRNA
jgi:3-isopropylmalate dehydrogenase